MPGLLELLAGKPASGSGARDASRPFGRSTGTKRSQTARPVTGSPTTKDQSLTPSSRPVEFRTPKPRATRDIPSSPDFSATTRALDPSTIRTPTPRSPEGGLADSTISGQGPSAPQGYMDLAAEQGMFLSPSYQTEGGDWIYDVNPLGTEPGQFVVDQVRVSQGDMWNPEQFHLGLIPEEDRPAEDPGGEPTQGPGGASQEGAMTPELEALMVLMQTDPDAFWAMIQGRDQGPTPDNEWMDVFQQGIMAAIQNPSGAPDYDQSVWA